MKFLLETRKEVFFGGAAGPGKSEALLQAAAMFVDVPNYHAIIFRKTIASLELEGGLIPRSKEWWLERPNRLGQIAKWNGQKLSWLFPSNATVGFGYMNSQDDYMRYGSTEYQFIAFDEVTEWSDHHDYTFMFSRLRGTRDLTERHVPLRMRAAANPIGPGVVWVKTRFNLPEGTQDRPYIPGNLEDNASNIDVDAYLDSLSNLDPVTRQRLIKGDWSIKDAGRVFSREWLLSATHAPIQKLSEPAPLAIRYWDLAATAPAQNRDPDWTCGVLMARDRRGEIIVLDVKRWQMPPAVVEEKILQTAVEDHARTDVLEVKTWMEEEQGASGKSLIDHYARNVLQGYTFMGNRATGSKEIRAAPFSSYAANGHVWLLAGTWIGPYLDELEAFPYGGHDDQVDGSSGAFDKLSRTPSGEVEVGFGERYDAP